MKHNKALRITLLIFVALGFSGALKISAANLQASPCPHIWVVPVCYVVLAAYTLMLVSVVVNHYGCKHTFFIIGWSVAFVIALAGSVMEVVGGGGVCPTSGGSIRGGAVSSMPLCFASLALLFVILILFIACRYKRIR